MLALRKTSPYYDDCVRPTIFGNAIANSIVDAATPKSKLEEVVVTAKKRSVEGDSDFVGPPRPDAVEANLAPGNSNASMNSGAAPSPDETRYSQENHRVGGSITPVAFGAPIPTDRISSAIDQSTLQWMKNTESGELVIGGMRSDGRGPEYFMPNDTVTLVPEVVTHQSGFDQFASSVTNGVSDWWNEEGNFAPTTPDNQTAWSAFKDTGRAFWNVGLGIGKMVEGNSNPLVFVPGYPNVWDDHRATYDTPKFGVALEFLIPVPTGKLMMPARAMSNGALELTALNNVARVGALTEGVAVEATLAARSSAARAEAATNIWQARSILRETRPDLTVTERNQIIKAFDLESFRVNTITSPTTEFRYFDGLEGGAGLNGRWSTSQWLETNTERISNLALPNNQATRAATVTLQPGTTVFQGTVAPQLRFGPNLTGGAAQTYNAMGPRAIIEELRYGR